MLPTILRLPKVKSASGLSGSTIYSYIQQGLWIKPVRLGARSVGWPDYEVSALLSARISGNSDNEIRELVKVLEAKRKDFEMGGN